MAAKLFGYFPPPDVGDPEVMLAGAVKMFLSFPREAVEMICDPVSGLPAKSKWSPKLAEIRLALEAAAAPIYRAIEREKQIAEQLEARKQIPDMRPRPTYAELQRRCAKAGLYIGQEKHGLKPITVQEMREKHGISEEQWNDIPDAKSA